MMTNRVRNAWTMLSACLMLFGAIPAAPAQDDRPAPAVPEIQTIMPEHRHRRIIRPDWQPVEVQNVNANVVIDGDVARTTLAITLHNPSSQRAQCELVVPVPGEAAISSFSLDGLSGDPGAVLLPRDKARKTFEEIVRKMVDPGLLEFAGYGLIKSSVFPVPANGEQTFRVTYEQVAKGDGTSVEYELPRSGSLGNAPDWKIGVEIKGDAPVLSVLSPSHKIDVEIKDGVAHVTGKDLADPGAFRLVAMRQKGDGPAMSLLTYPDPESVDAGFFMLLMAAPEKSLQADRVPREVTIVLDRSGSMQGEKFEQARDAAIQVIRGLDDNETFRIIDYSNEVAEFSSGVDARHDERVQMAVEYLKNLKAVGGTNINEALMTAVRPEPHEGYLPITLFLTDGLPTVGVTDEKSIRENILKANNGVRRLFTFGVGNDVNVPLLSDLARESRAVPEFVSPGEDVEAAVGRVFDRLAGPVLTDLRLTAQSRLEALPITDVFPRQMGDLFEAQRLVVLGRYSLRAGGFPLIVRAKSPGGDFERRITLDPRDASPANSHIARLWAQQNVTWLIDELRSAGADPRVQQLDSLREDPKLRELIDEIVRLSTKYGILTEYTSFLAAEDSMTASVGRNVQELDAMIQSTNATRSGTGGVALGEAQQARRDMGGGGGLYVVQPQAPKAQEAFRAVADSAAAPVPAEREYQYANAQLAMQNVGPDTLYNQRSRWVDAQLVQMDQNRAEGEKIPEPDETVAFGSARYFEIAGELATQSRQGLMAVPGDVEILLEGKRILVQNPA
ncbi:MAG: VWA domain-containing protein [Phycisphaeraceae bacterium]|nr:MAG: VWA domain-containing protein [Phycisphaeraceae bacterium]